MRAFQNGIHPDPAGVPSRGGASGVVSTPEVSELLAAAESALAAGGAAESRTQAEWLVAAAAGVGRLDLFTRDPIAWAPAARDRLEGWVRRVAAGEPLQYVLGSAPFMGREFACDPRALIPRPETEELCERVLADSRIWGRERPRVVDVGTGTGCIAITLALERPDAVIHAGDLSRDALDLAQHNARQLGVPEGRIAWRRGDLLDGQPRGAADAVVSNPPYVAEDGWADLDRVVRDHEPRLALAGGPDGLAVIRRLIEQAVEVLRPGGMLWLETGNEQGPAVRRLLAGAGFGEVAVFRDMAGHERIAAARRTP